MTNWIKLEDQKPPALVKVLVRCEMPVHDDPGVENNNFAVDWMHMDGTFDWCEGVIEWMMIPDPGKFCRYRYKLHDSEEWLEISALSPDHAVNLLNYFHGIGAVEWVVSTPLQEPTDVMDSTETSKWALDVLDRYNRSKDIRQRIEVGFIMEQSYFHESGTEHFQLISLSDDDDFPISQEEWEWIKGEFDYRSETKEHPVVTRVTYFFKPQEVDH